MQLTLRSKNFSFLPLLRGDVADHGDNVMHFAIIAVHAFDIHVGHYNRTILADEALVRCVAFRFSAQDTFQIGGVFFHVRRICQLNQILFGKLLVGITEHFA